MRNPATAILLPFPHKKKEYKNQNQTRTTIFPIPGFFLLASPLSSSNPTDREQSTPRLPHFYNPATVLSSPIGSFSHGRLGFPERQGSASEMRVEDSSLTGYLVEHLQSLTPADPVILAEYVVALLKKDKPAAELQKLCNDSLVDFLGHSTKSFTKKMFQSLEDGSIVRPVDTFDTIKTSEPSEHPDAVDRLELKSLVSKDDEQSISKKEQEFSSSPRATTDPEDEVSDDDDDRNHKHRRRDPQPLPFDKVVKSRFLGRWKSKPDGPFENGHLFQESHWRPGENKRECNSLLDGDPSLKFGKIRTGKNPSQASTYSGQRTPIGQTIWKDPGPPFDPNTSSARPSGGRGRGRGTGPWSQHDSRFVPLGTLDFAPHMASQGLHHPSMFVGAGLPATANTQNAAWGGYGLVPGMPNVCMDPHRPLGLQGAMHSSINPQMNLGMPRQRCRDFEEQGFCLRGDMCPMEHGVNRIVVEDVQGLSQFNLPVSLPCTHASGVQKGLAPTNSAVASSSLLSNSSLPNRSNKSVVAVEGPGLNEAISLAGGESDVYDPDQPLWNNKHPETSKGIVRIPLSKAGVSEPLWGGDSLDSQTFRLSDTHDEEEPIPHNGTNLFPEGRGDVDLQSKMKMTGTTENYVRTATRSRDNESEDDQEEEMLTDGVGSGNNGRLASTEERNTKALGLGSMSWFCKDARLNDRTSQKAWRTLFVCGVPQQNNKKETLLSHFEKFGEVIDIYIPMHSDKAFVQFSKREDAVAALKAPDAVMGNRFIKLFWANRDNTVDEKKSSQGKVVAAPLPLQPRITSSVHMKPTYVGGKDPPYPVTQKENNISSSGAVLPAVPAKFLIVNTPKTTITLKKRDTLEFLKEELRKKQEQLEQKRNDFRNQLDKLEKQAITASKQDPVAQQPLKKQKTNRDTIVAVSPITDPAASHETETQPEAESMLDKSVPRDSAALPSPKPDSAMNRQSAKSSVSRFKLDNRPTGFRILPPLPVELSDVAAIKKHFSVFGDLSAVEFEDPEGKSCSGCLEQPSPNFHVCVNFKTRRSAERAFISGKCWQGHNLQFAWFTASSEVSAQKLCPRSDTRRSQTTEVQPGNVVVCGSLSNANVISDEVGVSLEPLSKTDGENVEPCSTICNTIGVTDNGEGMDVDGIHCIHESNKEQSIPTMLSSDNSPSKSDIPAVKDSTDIVSETQGSCDL